MAETLYPDIPETPMEVNEPAVATRRRARTAPARRTLGYQRCQQRADQELNELWDAGILDQSKLDQYRRMHIRDVLG